jgi:hypothetical protein
MDTEGLTRGTWHEYIDNNDKLYDVVPGANPTIVSYNTSAVKIYNATSSLVHLEKQKYFLLSWKTLQPITMQV